MTRTETERLMPRESVQKAEAMLKDAPEEFDVPDAFAVLQATSQEICPTVVSMVFDMGERTVFWCENRDWDRIRSARLNI